MMGWMVGHEHDVLLEKLLSGDAQNVHLNLILFQEYLIWEKFYVGFFDSPPLKTLGTIQ